MNSDNSEESLVERYWRDIQRYEVLSADAEAALWQRVLAGDSDAKECLVKHHLRYVVGIAREYASPGVSVLDLINEGNIALLRAVETYECRDDKRFAQYAVHAVRQAMQTFKRRATATAENADLDNPHHNRFPTIDSDLGFADHDALLSALLTLPPREQMILSSCFGIGRAAMTLQEVAIDNGISRGRVKSLRKRALRHLRQCAAYINREE